ncbi:hypothetical protein [Kitasatospora sp. NPDC101183]|uniref:hypothetical protein n=1 Tax=Kitasatospora sp. NPDC101183 TaxID=3364100 RepID=UPI0038231C09
MALFVAAVLADIDELGYVATLTELLEWLGCTADDADDLNLAIAEQPPPGHETWVCMALRAFRDQRPTLFAAVRPFLDHPVPEVRELAVVTMLPLSEHPDLASHRGEVIDHSHRLLASSTHRRRRDRVLGALKDVGHDTSTLENASDIEARERRARFWANSGSGPRYSESPPF